MKLKFYAFTSVSASFFHNLFFDTKKMKIITLCGSTRFKKEFHKLNSELTKKGNVVFSVAVFSHADKIELSKKELKKLEKVHKRKIAKSQKCIIVDICGYLGESTKREIQYAESKKIKIVYLSKSAKLKRLIK